MTEPDWRRTDVQREWRTNRNRRKRARKARAARPVPRPTPRRSLSQRHAKICRRAAQDSKLARRFTEVYRRLPTARARGQWTAWLEAVERGEATASQALRSEVAAR